MEKKNEQEPKYYTSPINNQVLNYRIYYLSINEKILVNLFLVGINRTASPRLRQQLAT